jgi:Domain of unknown function (DUF4383)
MPTAAEQGRPTAELTIPVLARAFCLLYGPFLLLDGLLGLVFAGTSFRTGPDLPHRTWNFFVEFNSWHHVSHVVTGAVLIVGACRRSLMPAALLVFGGFYALAAPLGFIDGSDVLNVIYSDTRDNVIHALLAASALALGGGMLVVRRS